MIPASVLGTLGISFGELVGTAAEQATLRDMFQIAAKQGDPRGIFSRFVGEFFKDNPGATRAAAQEAYREAKAWVNLGAAYARSGFQESFDPALYRNIEAHGSGATQYGMFIHNVSVIVTDPLSGKSRTYGVTLHDELPMSMADINFFALERVGNIVAESPTVGGQRDLDGLEIQVQLMDLMRLVA